VKPEKKAASAKVVKAQDTTIDSTNPFSLNPSSAGDCIIESQCSMQGKSVLEIFTNHTDWVDKVILSDVIRSKLSPIDLQALLAYRSYLELAK
jgi:hypothetical protein